MNMRSQLPLAFVLCTVVFAASPQDYPPGTEQTNGGESQQVESDVRTRLSIVLDRDYSHQPADELLTFAIQHSDVAVPELKRRLIAYSQQSRKALAGNAALHADALAYVANVLAVDALCDLCVGNADLFCPYLERSLDYAEGRLNPFTLAYLTIAKPEAAVQAATIHWADSMIGSPHFRQRFAEAMLDRYGKVPGDSEWAADPIASRLRERLSQELRQAVLRMAEDVMRKREPR
jgi:hypothetical protein